MFKKSKLIKSDKYNVCKIYLRGAFAPDPATEPDTQTVTDS